MIRLNNSANIAQRNSEGIQQSPYYYLPLAITVPMGFVIILKVIGSNPGLMGFLGIIVAVLVTQQLILKLCNYIYLDVLKNRNIVEDYKAQGLTKKQAKHVSSMDSIKDLQQRNDDLKRRMEQAQKELDDMLQ